MGFFPGNYVAILDVGHGNCCVISDNGVTSVIDTGLGTSLLEFLSERGITTLDMVLLSHADQDHISGLIHLLASTEFSIGCVRLNTDSAKGTKLWKNLVYELETQESKGKLNWEVQLTVDSGEDLAVGNVGLEVIAPGKALAALGPGNKTKDERKITSNSVSAVILLSKSEKPIAAIPGDLDELGLQDLKRRLNGQKRISPVLVYPHHGASSGSSGSAQFAIEICELFSPKVVIFSIGRGLHGTPRPEVVDAIRRKAGRVKIACTQLSEHCSATVPALEPSHLLPVYSEGRGDRKCCAGTMVIDLDDDGELRPADADHGDFIDKHAVTALCRL
ncbi:ComEC family competence protein [Symmachiella dynata]|uniref:ComEC family competence protein n=1 Tax=Symmachiella dynata TaxID=2527995 RepID=A0A517ZGW4_9PLAN|nr:MBL fold metallo-hydrolase [Symmachiella dynata]QDU41715.1 ComEC family competence protein [Symmachiella dynata]